MGEVIEDVSTLVVHECWCGIRHAIPENLSRRARDDGASVHCPLGHVWVFKRTEFDRARDKAARLQAQLDQERAAHRDTENRRRAEKAAKTRLRRRVQAGVCPHCTRTFQNLQRHIQSQHQNCLAEEAAS